MVIDVEIERELFVIQLMLAKFKLPRNHNKLTTRVPGHSTSHNNPKVEGPISLSVYIACKLRLDRTAIHIGQVDSCHMKNTTMG